MKIYITRPIPKNGVAMLKAAGHKVTMQPKPLDLPVKELLKAVKGYDGVLSFLSNPIDDKFFAAAGPALKVVANYAVGYDNIDIAAATQCGIKVSNAPCIEVSRAVAEHAFALMMALSRRIVEADTFTRAKKYKGWDPDLFIGHDMYDTTLGIVGLGGIGKEVAKRAVKGFGMSILYSDMKPDAAFEKEYGAKYVPLKDVLAQSDIVTLHVPLLPSTRHLINAKTLKMMKKTALLINTARGPVVDETAVLKALYASKLAGFGLDVYECEPAIDCNLKDRYELRALSNVVMTPHIASATIRAREGMARVAAENLIAGLAGKAMLQQIVLK